MKRPENNSETVYFKIDTGRRIPIDTRNPALKTLPNSHPAQKLHKSYQRSYERVAYIKHHIEKSMNNPEYLSLMPKDSSPPKLASKSVAKASYFPEVKITSELKEKMKFIQAYNDICEAKNSYTITARTSFKNQQDNKPHKNETIAEFSSKMFKIYLLKTEKCNKKSTSTFKSQSKRPKRNNEDNFYKNEQVRTEGNERSPYLGENYYNCLAKFGFPEKQVQKQFGKKKHMHRNASTHRVWPKKLSHFHSRNSLS